MMIMVVIIAIVIWAIIIITIIDNITRDVSDDVRPNYESHIFRSRKTARRPTRKLKRDSGNPGVRKVITNKHNNDNNDNNNNNINNNNNDNDDINKLLFLRGETFPDVGKPWNFSTLGFSVDEFSLCPRGSEKGAPFNPTSVPQELLQPVSTTSKSPKLKRSRVWVHVVRVERLKLAARTG